MFMEFDPGSAPIFPADSRPCGTIIPDSCSCSELDPGPTIGVESTGLGEEVLSAILQNEGIRVVDSI